MCRTCIQRQHAPQILWRICQPLFWKGTNSAVFPTTSALLTTILTVGKLEYKKKSHFIVWIFIYMGPVNMSSCYFVVVLTVTAIMNQPMSCFSCITFNNCVFFPWRRIVNLPSKTKSVDVAFLTYKVWVLIEINYKNFTLLIWTINFSSLKNISVIYPSYYNQNSNTFAMKIFQ